MWFRLDGLDIVYLCAALELLFGLPDLDVPECRVSSETEGWLPVIIESPDRDDFHGI